MKYINYIMIVNNINIFKALNKALNDQNLALKDIIHKILFKIKSYEAQEILREQHVEVDLLIYLFKYIF